MSVDHPSLTVVVAVLDEAGLPATIDSLACQTLRPSEFEVVLVGDVTSRPEHAGFDVRRLGIADPDRRGARAAGMAMARGEYVTFVEAGDTVSPWCLEALLAIAAPDVIGFAHQDGSSTSDALAVALGSVSGAILPTVLGRAVGCGPDDAGAVDALFLGRLVTRFGSSIDFCLAQADAVYFRRPGPPLQPDAARVAIDADLDAIRELRASSGPGGGGVVDGAVAGCVESLNRTLRSIPDLHGYVLDGIRARGITSIDYPRLNRGVARDLAILYAALPFSDTSANIAARRVRAAGVPVDVVSADLGRRAKVDNSATALWTEYVDELCRLPGPASLHGEWGPTSEFCRRGRATIDEWERAKGPYRSVYSRTMFPGSHLLAALHKLRRPEVHWLAEFSDPQLRDSRGRVRSSKGDPDLALLTEIGDGLRARGFSAPESDNVWEWAETATYALADSVLFTNDSQRAYMLGYCSDRAAADRARSVSHVVHHPTPPAHLYRAVDFAYDLDPDRVHIGYFGTFYPTRSLTEVVAALAALDPAARDRIRLHVFTKRPDELRDEAAAAGLADVLVVNGYLEFDEYLNLTTRFDVLIVNDYRTRGHHDRNPYLPAKYSDYVGSGSRIWGIVEPGSVLSTLPLDHRSELEDAEGARSVLELLASRRSG